MRFLLILVALIAAPAAARDDPVPLPLECSGFDPAWHMTLSADGSVFDDGMARDLDIAWQTRAAGAAWPRALTLIGRGVSAIVILESPKDTTFPVRVLTQREETPMLLIGMCQQN